MKFAKKILPVVIIFALLISNISIVFAQEKYLRLPSDISYENIGERIKSYVYKNEDTTAGMAVAVFNRDNVIYKGAFGYADKEKQIAVNEQTVFEWGSVSKILVWISVMQLQEEEKIDLNTDIQTYLPEGFLSNLNYNTPITMLNLMNHNAGFQDMVSDLFLADKDDVLDLGNQLKLHVPKQIYEPGTVTSYSNWSTGLAGYIVECISGEPYYQYVNKYIFRKLGMKHTAIATDLSDNEWVRQKRNELQSYTSGGKHIGNAFYNISLYPVGMCTSTMEDFLTFAQALLPAEGESTPLFEHEDTLNMLLSPTSYYGNTDIPLNCHGLWTLEYRVEVIGHAGNTAGCSSNLLLDPVSGTGVVVMTNQRYEQIYNYGIMQLIFGSYTQSKLSNYNNDVIDGFFRPARTITKGPMSLYDVFNLYTIGKDDSYGFWVYSDNNGLEKYTAAGGDMFKLSSSEYIPMIVILLLFAMGVLYSAITLVFGGCIIAPLQRRRKQKKGIEQISYSFRTWNYSSCGMILLLTANIMWFCYQASTYAPSKNYSWQCAVCGILGILMTISVGILIRNWKKISNSKREKIKYIITATFLMVAISVILNWELYAFWKL